MNVSYPLCASCRAQKRSLHFDLARAAGIYDGNLKQCIHAVKYNGKKSLVPALADILFSFLTGGGVNDFPLSDGRIEVKKEFLFPEINKLDAVACVPMDAKKERQRGFNQSELLAEAISQRAGILNVHALRKIKTTPPQVTLSEKERWENVKGAFDIIEEKKQAVKGKKLLLVDDVLTTGATAGACSLVLRKNGAARVFVATIANTS